MSARSHMISKVKGTVAMSASPRHVPAMFLSYCRFFVQQVASRKWRGAMWIDQDEVSFMGMRAGVSNGTLRLSGTGEEICNHGSL